MGENGRFIRERGSIGLTAGYFNNPHDVALSPFNGNIYISDEENHRIQQFNKDGSFIQQWGSRGTNNGQFNYPWGISISTNGSVYVTDFYNHRIQQFSANGDFIRMWGGFGSEEGEFKYPGGIAISVDGNIYVTDSGNDRVQKFTAKGEFIHQWGNEGSVDGQFSFPLGIAITHDGNNIYVTDGGIINGNHRVQQFNSNGDFIRKWGSEGSETGKFDSPSGITIANDGSIYVADTFNNRIQQFSADGVFISQLGNFGLEPGQFSVPYGITIADDGSLYVADTRNNRIQKFIPKSLDIASHPYKAIVLAGGGPSKGNYKNLIWDETEILTNKAHQALRSQGFSKDEVKYLTAGNTLGDLDGNGKSDDLETASLNSLQQAITGWAKDATDVLIYLVDHGGPGRFQINDREILTSEQLTAWVNQLDNLIPGKVTVIIESCQSGSFLGSLAKQRRNLIASADKDQPAIISNKGLNSFSYFFWSEISAGATLQEAFKTGRQGMSAQFVQGRPQSAQLDSNGDTLFNATDYNDLASFCIGNCTKYYSSAQTIYASSAPVILSVTEPKILEGETTAELSMQINEGNITQAWVSIIAPDFKHPELDKPVSELNKIPLKCDANQRCTTQYKDFTLDGEYQATFYAQNINFQMAIPKSTTITQTNGILDTSDPETDETPKSSEITANYNDLENVNYFV